MAAADSRDENIRVAVLGTGIMGSAVARNLVSAGLPTTVWDRSPAAYAAVQPAFSAIGRKTVWLGEAGQGSPGLYGPPRRSTRTLPRADDTPGTGGR